VKSGTRSTIEKVVSICKTEGKRKWRRVPFRPNWKFGLGRLHELKRLREKRNKRNKKESRETLETEEGKGGSGCTDAGEVEKGRAKPAVRAEAKQKNVHFCTSKGKNRRGGGKRDRDRN